MNSKINSQNILPFIYSLLLFNVGVVTLRFKVLVNLLIILTFFITLFLCFVNFKNVINFEIQKYVPLLLVYVVLILISAFLNKDNFISVSTISSTFKYLMFIFSVLFGFSILFRVQDLNSTIKIFLYLSLIYCFINDVLCIPQLTTLRVTQNYLLGNKFNVALTHTITLAFFCVYSSLNYANYRNNSKFLFQFWNLVIYILLADLMVDCFTGIIGLFVFVFVFLGFNKKLFLNSLFWLIIFLITSFIPFFYDKIMNSKFYQILVIDKLGRSTTMTGRMNIYKQIPYFMFNHWHWGYGYGTSYSVVENLINMPDTQNGTLELILQNGIYSTIVFVVLVLFLFYRSTKNYSILMVPFISVIYVLTITSAFEITYSFEFITISAIIIALSNSSIQIRGKYETQIAKN